MESLSLSVSAQDGEMAQWLRALTGSSRGPEFMSQKPQDGSQPVVMGSDELLEKESAHYPL